jgi:taurine dioxygenase
MTTSLLNLTMQVTFAKIWGELEAPHPFYPGGQHGVVKIVKGTFILSNDQSVLDSATPGTENMWHSDVSWKAVPPKGNLSQLVSYLSTAVVVLRIIEVPPFGGDTLWCDIQAVYDNLSAEFRTKIDSLRAQHDWAETFGQTINEERFEAVRKDYPPVSHPVVRTHPETGRKGVYVNIDFTHHIEDLPVEEGNKILDFIYGQIAVPEYQVRFHWTPNTVAVWDNIATQHYACCDYYPHRRSGERVSIEGDAKPI